MVPRDVDIEEHIFRFWFCKLQHHSCPTSHR